MRDHLEDIFRGEIVLLNKKYKSQVTDHSLVKIKPPELFQQKREDLDQKIKVNK